MNSARLFNTDSPHPMATPIATRILHTMLRVADLDRALAFYTGVLGMTLFRRQDFEDGRFSLAFVGFGREDSSPAIELTFNWDGQTYERGTAYGHVALSVPNAACACAALAASGVKVVRAAGAMAYASTAHDRAEVIAFIEDPDGYRIELVERRSCG